MQELKKIRQQEAFKVPENYFSSFEDKLMDRITPQQVEQKVYWFDRLVYQLQLRFSIPAMMVVSLVLIIIYISLEQKNESLLISDGEIRNYLIEEYDDNLESTIYSDILADYNEAFQMSDDDIFEYLSEENIELEIIEEYLP